MTDSSMFADRSAAGRALARIMDGMALQPPVIVLGLPRGGVPVAYEVASSLHAPLDVMVVRKIGMPGQPEFAIGAIASGGIILRAPGITVPHVRFERLAAAGEIELRRRERAYRGAAPALDLRGHSVVLVDDGLATGATMLAAVRAARKAGAGSVVVAAPVASDQAADLVAAEADEMVILKTPAYLSSIGQWYEDFEQVSDAEVCALLAQASSSQERDRPSVSKGHTG